MLRHGVVACICLAACVAAEDFLEPEETGLKPSTLERQKITFNLEHDVSGTGGAFTKRNEVMYEAAPGAKRNRPTVRVSKFAFTPEEVESIEQLARSGGVYRIRAPTSIQGGTENYVMSYVPACALVASRYTEHLVFHLGRNGNILGVDLSTPNTDCSAVTATPPRKGQGKKVQVSSTVRVDLGMDAEKSVTPCSPCTRSALSEMSRAPFALAALACGAPTGSQSPHSTCAPSQDVACALRCSSALPGGCLTAAVGVSGRRCQSSLKNSSSPTPLALTGSPVNRSQRKRTRDSSADM